MMEHMKNYEALLGKISTWLKPNKEAKGGEALLFIHIFCHKTTPFVLLSFPRVVALSSSHEYSRNKLTVGHDDAGITLRKTMDGCQRSVAPSFRLE